LAKTTYTYKQVNIPVEAQDFINNAHDIIGDKSIRKADLWIYATKRMQGMALFDDKDELISKIKGGK
tara:strand:+ start:106 stop:306 length:201 start_codon:yes stop_codon:yes gene_type:complete